MTTIEPTDQPVPTAVLDGAIEEYPRDKLYVMTAVFLAAITAVEVMTYVAPKFPAWHWGGSAGIITVLMVLMAVKFSTVAYVFMHLKFDKPLLSGVFYGGVVAALAVFLAVLTIFRVWWPEGHYSGPYSQ